MKYFIDIGANFPDMTTQKHPYNVDRYSSECLFILVEETSGVERGLTIGTALERFTSGNTSRAGLYLAEIFISNVLLDKPGILQMHRLRF